MCLMGVEREFEKEKKEKKREKKKPLGKWTIKHTVAFRLEAGSG